MSESFPPPGFVSVPSAVEGIAVYAPALPETGPHQEVVDFKCPRCGAVTAYSVVDGGLRCAHCGYYEPPQAPAVGKAAPQFEFTLEALEQAARGWGEERRDLCCQSCSAQLSLPPGQLTSTCPFCGSNRVIQRAAPQDLLRPRFLIPFRVENEACHQIARTWLGSSWMTPAVLQQTARVADFVGIYLPFWTFHAQAAAAWRAEVGHTVTERYFQGGQWRTRTRTVWQWKSGHVQRRFDDCLMPGTGKVSRLLLRRIQAYDLQGLVPYKPEFLAGLHAQAYDIPLEQAWESARAEMREQTRKAALAQAGSTGAVRNFSMTLDFADESWRYILLPVYLAVYLYQGQPYQVMVNGQTGAIAGQRPVDWNKIWLAIGAALAPGLLLILIGLVTAMLGVGVAVGGIGFVLLVIGIVVAIVLFSKAQGLDDA